MGVGGSLSEGGRVGGQAGHNVGCKFDLQLFVVMILTHRNFQILPPATLHDPLRSRPSTACVGRDSVFSMINNDEPTPTIIPCATPSTRMPPNVMSHTAQT
jgi:hypothetical protein